jgi:hypothetical protein
MWDPVSYSRFFFTVRGNLENHIMLLRILLIMALVGLGLWLLRKALRARRPPPAQPDPEQARLVACAHCGARIPATDALWREGQSFCSMTHRHLGPRS